MDRQRALRRRLATQRLTSAPLPTAADVVRLLTCVQSQERDHSFFALSQRSRATTYAAVRAEHDAGAFVRTHILRPTWHYVAPEDLRWILALTAPRVEQLERPYLLKFGYDEPTIGRAFDVMTGALEGRNVLTRKEIGEHMSQAGLLGSGEGLGHLLLVAEQRGLICGGPVKGAQHTYGLVDELVPATPERSRDEALAELAHRFFAGHGPASVKDLARWASLTVADARHGLAALGGTLEQVDVDGIPHWFDPSLPARTTRGDVAHLLTTYDEVTLTYPAVSFPFAPGVPEPEEFPWYTAVVVDETRVGTWRRTLGGDRVVVETLLAPGTTPRQRALVDDAVGRLGAFHGLPVEHVRG
ncbi:winged helix DNA-binding domain-containing protein [Terrabacter sp. MAHUQ-38]|uniref:winged helix DNA-binding domain-containing protein n=1 Tax=unclassified Terrabacter TaxID=2630222 RepID=UPI00165E2049|nr:winged helix DNA-binding domain-containing protein [Terrabacter sp. MAHUQ-38]MBC9820621.1 AlkZ family DNA glycosylase [Terrabacter sp. MAHUQ-38]